MRVAGWDRLGTTYAILVVASVAAVVSPATAISASTLLSAAASAVATIVSTRVATPTGICKSRITCAVVAVVACVAEWPFLPLAGARLLASGMVLE